jgi:hypothetical protein
MRSIRSLIRPRRDRCRILVRRRRASWAVSSPAISDSQTASRFLALIIRLNIPTFDPCNSLVQLGRGKQSDKAPSAACINLSVRERFDNSRDQLGSTPGKTLQTDGHLFRPQSRDRPLQNKPHSCDVAAYRGPDSRFEDLGQARVELRSKSADITEPRRAPCRIPALPFFHVTVAYRLLNQSRVHPRSWVRLGI